MTVKDFPGAVYVDASLDGRAVVTWLNGRTEFWTEFGKTLGFLNERGKDAGPLQVRLGPGTRFAGQTVEGNRIKEWTGVEWVDRGPAFGANACIYNGNTLVTNPDGKAPFFAYGFRQVLNGQVIAAADTYRLDAERIAEYSQVKGLRIGQGTLTPGYPDDYLAMDWKGARYTGDKGPCKFIRADGNGTQFVAAFQMPDKCRAIWFTASEIGSAKIPKVVPTTDPDPEPKPVCELVYVKGETGNCPKCGNPKSKHTLKDPEPTMERKDLPADVHAIVVALHAKYADTLGSKQASDDDRRMLAQKIAETVCARKGKRWGLKSANSSLNPRGKDTIAEIPEGDEFAGLGNKQTLYIWDLFNGSTRKPNPMPVRSVPEDEAAQYFIPVDPVDHLTGTEPDPDPDPDPDDLAKLKEHVLGLQTMALEAHGKAEAALAVIETLHSSAQTKFDEIDEELAKLRAGGSNGISPDNVRTIISEYEAAGPVGRGFLSVSAQLPLRRREEK